MVFDLQGFQALLIQASRDVTLIEWRVTIVYSDLEQHTIVLLFDEGWNKHMRILALASLTC